jgi:hypothetical protein
MVELLVAKSVKKSTESEKKINHDTRKMIIHLFGCSAQQWKILMSKYMYKHCVRLLWHYINHSNLKQMKNYRPLNPTKEKPTYYHLNPLLYTMVPRTVCKLNVFTNQIEYVRELQPNRLYEY